MTDKTIVFQAPDGTMVAVLATDTGTSDGSGHQIYRLGVDTEIDVGPISIGAITVKDATAATQAAVKTVTVIAEADAALAVQAPVLGAKADAADKAGGSSSVNAKLRGMVQLLAAGLATALGQAAMAASMPVVIASNQTAVPVTLATDVELGSVKLLDAAGTNEAKIAASTAIAEANNAIAAHDPTVGISTGAAVVTDANGTVQQYLRGLVKLFAAVLPATIGQKAMATSLPIVIASDQSAVAVSGNVGHASQTVSPADQVTTAAFVDVTGSQIDTLANLYLSYTIVNTDLANALTYEVLAANNSDYSDSVIVKTPTSVLAGADDSYVANPAVYRYYKMLVKDTVAAAHATAKVRGLSKG